MGLVERKALIGQLSPPIDNLLAIQLVDEFISLERRYIQRDWEPAELDGGQFCEVLARSLYHLDSGTLNRGKDFDDCLKYIENEQVAHSVQPRRDALHLARVLRTTYKFRSQRGAVHISPDYSPNQMDAKLVTECVRWLMMEALRVFSKADRPSTAKSIRELLQFDVPSIGVFEDQILVQRTDLTCEEEILVLLHFAGEIGFTRNEMGRHCKFSPASVTRALQSLVAPNCRQVIELSGGKFRLTDLGSRRVWEKLSDKLLVQ